MSNLIWRGDAKETAQVVKITPSNPEEGDTFTIKINGKVVSFVAEDTSVASVVAGLVEAWNAATFPEATLITAEDEGTHLTLTADNAGQPFRVETETTDAGGFEIEVSELQAGDPGQNEIQRVAIPAAASGGTFTLTFEGQTTAAIAYDANAATVETALEALSNIAPGDVIVTGDSPTWFVEFDATYANTNVATLTGDGASLTGAASLVIETTTEGRPKDNEIREFTVSSSGFYLWWDGIWTRSDGPDGGGFFIGGSDPDLIAEDLDTLLGGATGSIIGTRTASGSNFVYRFEFAGDYAGQNFEQALQFGTSSSFSDASTATTIQEGNANPTNEVQTVRINGGPTGGTFTLTFQGQTTAGIAFDASAAAVEAALEALSNIDDVTVTKSGTTYTITFGGTLAGTDVAQLTGSSASLTGAAVSVAATQEATDPANEREQISFSQPPGGGTFTLSWDPGTGAETTGAIAYNASAATVQTALEALATPAPGDFSVSGSAGGPWTVEFTGTYAATAVNEITGDGSSLTGGGSQGLALETTTRSGGPNHFDDPDNWTGEAVPNSLDSLYFSGGAVGCLYGLRQRVTFTADASSDTITFAEAADFVENQGLRLFTNDTLPAGLSAATTYFVKNLDYDAGTCQLSATAGGAAIDITDTGTGTHTIGLHLTAIKMHSRWTGAMGLDERNELEFYEYLPRSLAVVVDAVTIGEGEGDGQAQIDLDTGSQATTIIVHQTGGSNDPGLPAIRWKGIHSSNAITVHDGEFGVAVYATETATIGTLVQHSGIIQMGTATIGSLTKHGGELVAENATLSGALQLHG